ncbi:hypothetical protein BC629DRAFT_1522961 [Irpex lacteus]|nr:hypothetical protein BC629DRAFT_1522961 [Irpex lacteus]
MTVFVGVSAQNRPHCPNATERASEPEQHPSLAHATRLTKRVESSTLAVYLLTPIAMNTKKLSRHPSSLEASIYRNFQASVGPNVSHITNDGHAYATHRSTYKLHIQTCVQASHSSIWDGATRAGTYPEDQRKGPRQDIAAYTYTQALPSLGKTYLCPLSNICRNR